MDEQFAALRTYIAEQVEATGIPGAAVGILYGETTYSAGFGVTNINHPVAVTDGTLFQIGSITKTFTALLIMQLVEEGRVTLDRPIQHYLPEFRVEDLDVSAQVTFAHLLTHTAGWVGDFFLDTGHGEEANERYVAQMAGLPQLAPLGYSVSYNNAGFSLCGAVIEAVTGQSFQALIHERILEPLGMEHAYFDARDVITHRFVVGHLVSESTADTADAADPTGEDISGAPSEPSNSANGVSISVAEPWELPHSVYAAGGLCCSVMDLLKYAWLQMGDGCNADGSRVVSPEALAELHRLRVRIDSSYEGVGLSWFTGARETANSGRQRYITHTGGTNGQITQLLIVPDSQFAVAIFTNANRGREVIDGIVRNALKLFLGVEWSHPKPGTQNEAELAGYCGQYSRPHADVKLYLEDGQLYMQLTPQGGFPNQDSPIPPPPPPAKCAFYADDRIIVLEGASKNSHLEVVRQDNGDIGWIRFGMRLHRRIP